MEKLHSFAFYALVSPILTLGAGFALAQQSIGQDVDPEWQSTQRDEYVMLSTSRAAWSDQSTQSVRLFGLRAAADHRNAGDLIGAEVKATDDVGSVIELLIGESDQVVIIVVGGSLGMGEEALAIGWEDVAIRRF